MATFDAGNNCGARRRETKRKATHDERQETHEAFFEVSKVVASPDMLRTWIEWFKGLNIPCAIARVSGGYTLWRKGEEIGRTRAKATVLKRKNIVYSFGL